MTPEQFCYWLQGRAEMDPSPPTTEQWEMIREHLSTVFKKETKLEISAVDTVRQRRIEAIKLC